MTGKKLPAQITLEALIVITLALSFLLISAYSISRMQKAESSLFERSMLKSQLNEIAAMSDEICVLGEGNYRAVPLAHLKFSLASSQGGRLLEVSSGDWKAVAKTVCKNNLVGGAPYGNEIYLWREDAQTVAISPIPYE